MTTKAKRIPFSEHEAAVLLDGSLKVADGALDRTRAVSAVSKTLRKMATSRGAEIDDSFRSEAGIRSQLDKMDAALSGNTKGVAVPRLFISSVSEYRSNPEKHKSLLEEALAIAGETSAVCSCEADAAAGKERILMPRDIGPVEAVPLVSTSSDELLSERYPILFKRVYSALRRLSADYSRGADAHQVREEIRRIGRLEDVEMILASASWAHESGGARYRFGIAKACDETLFEDRSAAPGGCESISSASCGDARRVPNKNDYKAVPLSKLGLTRGRLKALEDKGLSTLYELVDFYNNGFLPRVPGFGPKGIEIVEDIIRSAGAPPDQSREPVEGADAEENAGSRGERRSVAGENTLGERTAEDDVCANFPLPGDVPGDEAPVVELIGDGGVFFVDSPKRNGRAMSLVSGGRRLRDVFLFSQDVLSRSTLDIGFNAKIENVLRRNRVLSVSDVVNMTKAELLGLDCFGPTSLSELVEHLVLLETIVPVEEAWRTILDSAGLDLEIVRRLKEEYGFREDEIRILLEKTPSELDLEEIETMVEEGKYFHEGFSSSYHLVNNGKGSACFVVIAPDGVRLIPKEKLYDSLKAIIQAKRIDTLFEDEFLHLEEMGEVVSILNVDHFRPFSGESFRIFAERRGFSPEEYSDFLFSLPYASAGTKCTDKDIRPYLESLSYENLELIEHSEEMEWLRSFMRRRGVSIFELLETYGIEISPPTIQQEACDSLEEESGIRSFNLDERDMEEEPCEGGLVDRAFAEHALIGSAILEPEELAALNEEARAMLSRLSKHGARLETDESRRALTLAVVNAAKDWGAAGSSSGLDDESHFWKYIASRFGYNDASDTLQRKLYEEIERGLSDSGKWLISDEVGKRRKATVLSHALAPKADWLQLCEILFTAFVELFGGVFEAGDSRVRRIVSVLADKLRSTSQDVDEEIQLSGNVYVLYEGTRKLILRRPLYVTQMFDRLLTRIDALYNQRASAAVAYEDKLCDIWWEEKIRSTEEIRAARALSERGGSRTRSVKPAYRLGSDARLFLELPEISLELDAVTRIEAAFLVGDSVSYRFRLGVKGGDFCKRTFSDPVDVENLVRLGRASGLKPRVQIMSSDSLLFDSGQTLCRKAILFRGETEVAPSSCKSGEYFLVTPSSSQLSSSECEVELLKETSTFKTYSVVFHDGFTLELDGGPFVVDSDRIPSSFNLDIPSPWPDARFTTGGDEYPLVASEGAFLVEVKGEEDLAGVQLLLNGTFVPWPAPSSSLTEGCVAYNFTIPQGIQGFAEVAVYDLRRERVLYRRGIYVIKSLEYSFNKSYYFSDNDYRNAFVACEINDVQLDVAFGRGSYFVPIFEDNGSIELMIPAVEVTDSCGELWGGGFAEWAGNVKEGLRLSVRRPKCCSVEVTVLGDRIRPRRNGQFEVGSAINARLREGCHEDVDVFLVISVEGARGSVRYRIGRVVLAEGFVQTPRLFESGGTLMWNLGGKYLGDRGKEFSVALESLTGETFLYALGIDDYVIARELTLEEGEYRFTIAATSDDVFCQETTVLCKGSMLVGDENKLRFRNKKIVVDQMTYEENGENVVRNLERVWVEDIEFRGLTPEAGLPEYEGVLYRMAKKGKVPFDFEYYDDGKGTVWNALNPVIVTLVDGTYLSITDQDHDVPYCIWEPASGCYKVTAKETPDMRNSPSVPDLFLYRTERI